MRKLTKYLLSFLMVCFLIAPSINVFAATSSKTSTPPAPTLSYSPMTPTNQNVTVKINYPSSAVIKQYKLGTNGTWTTYTSPIVLTSNAYVIARYKKNSAIWSSLGGVTVSNIDKTPPSNPTFSLSTSTITNQSVTITVNFSSDSTYKQYKIGSEGIWIDYTEPLTINSNTIIYAKSSDEAGNWSEQVSYEINNLDKTPPANPIIIASTTELTNQGVTVTISYSLESSIQQYKIGDTGTWMDYTNPILLNTNEVIYAKATDQAGNSTEEVSYVVSNIDTLAPQTPVIYPSTTTSTSNPVKVNIQYSEDSVVKQYKIGLNGMWTDYITPIILTSNNTIYAKASDVVSNWSTETYYTVSNLMKLVVGYTVKYSSTDIASYNSIIANTNALSEIATATFTVDGSGNLTGTAPLDQLTYANNNGVETKLMVSNSFNATVAKQLLESSVNRQNLKNNILNLLNTYNYKGVDIDIENIPASCRDYFTTFMSEIYSSLNPLGYSVSVAVQAKTNDSPNATWNYAFDYKSLAMYSDYLMIMAYDEHYAGGTPGAVASIDWVTSVVNYTLTVVPKEKIVLGLAAYGYDWSSGVTKAYSINGCNNLAIQHGATVYLDDSTKSKYFTYTVNGVAHTVWFEDNETISYKLDLVNAKDLKGIGIWRLGLENASYWDIIKAKLNR